jgi:hypothetical protein
MFKGRAFYLRLLIYLFIYLCPNFSLKWLKFHTQVRLELRDGVAVVDGMDCKFKFLSLRINGYNL